jgi:hypothetical protein
MELADYVNSAPGEARLGLLNGYVAEERLASPIDMFRRSVLAVLAYGSDERLRATPLLGRALALSLVSATEAYFRTVMAECMELCPVAQANAADQSISLGGILWHGREGYSRGAFENGSLASKKDLQRTCKNFLGITLDEQTFQGPLDQFEIVCHLRHGLVHSDGLLPGKNAVAINMPRFQNPVRIKIEYEQLQDIGSVVSTLAFTLNRFLFDAMCKRWAIDWRQRASWNPADENILFSRVWRIFFCSDEHTHRAGRTNITRGKCQDAVKNTYNL